MRLVHGWIIGAILLVALTARVSSALVVQTQPSWYRVTNYSTIQAAIDTCIRNGGGVVYFPPGTYVLPASEPTLRIYPQPSGPRARRGVTLLGDGADVCEIRAPAGARDTMLHVLRDHARIQGISFTASDGDTTSIGIVLGDPAAGGAHVLSSVTFRDVTVRDAGLWCLKTTRPGITIMSTFDDCHFIRNGGTLGGLVCVDSGTTTIHFRGCSFEDFSHNAVRLDQSAGITFTDCVFEGERDNSGPFFYAHRSVDCTILSAWFEDDEANGVGLARDQWFVQLDQACHGFNLIASGFFRDGASKSMQPKTLQVLGSGANACMGVMLANPDIAIPGVVDSTSFDYVDIGSDDSQVYLIGGIVRDALAYKRIVISDRDGLMTFGGTRCLKLMRLPDAAIQSLPSSERGKLVYNKGTDRAVMTNGSTWSGIGAGSRQP